MAYFSFNTGFSRTIYKSSFILILFFTFSNYLSPCSFILAQEPLTLEDCIQIALRDNPEYKNAKLSTDIAKTLKADAVSSYLPNLSAVLSSSQTRVGPTINNKVVYQGIELSEGATSESPSFAINSHYIGASVSQLLFDGGASISRIKQENAHKEDFTLSGKLKSM